MSSSILKVWILLLVIGVANATVTITLVNKCAATIWPGILGNPRPTPSGFALDAGQTKVIKVTDGWNAARIWARTGCTGSDGSFKCQTGDCGNSIDCNGRSGQAPASLAEFTLGVNGLDFYDVSFVDGSNIPILVEPVPGTYLNMSTGAFECGVAGKCSKDLKDAVAEELKYKINGQVVGSLSPCSATNNAQYCCTGAHNTPATCKSNSFPAKYYLDLKAICPTSYLYAFDDYSSTFTCKAVPGRTSPDYKITFCQTGL